MAKINSPQLTRSAARPKEPRGGMRQSEVDELHPGLKEGKEPDLVRQGRRRPIAEIARSVAAAEPTVPVSAARRAMQHQRWQVGMA